jgi:hypothetical protein
MDVLVNGEPQELDAEPCSYAEIERRWRDGDEVEIRLPMTLRLYPMPDNESRVAVMYGPLVLAGDLGSIDDAADDPEYVPVLVTEGEEPEEWLERVDGEPATFRTDDVGRPRDVVLRPFYGIHHRRYNVYWDLFTREQWAEWQEEIRVERERQQRLEAITVDSLQPGEMQPERDHNFQGENTGAGDFGSRKWRHAPDGWFSYDVAVDPERPVALILTYWGSDIGNRTFDVLVDGETIATQTLQNNAPDEFFDVRHELSGELTADKEKVTVRFQAHPGNTAGGVFFLRMVYADEDLPA